MEAVVIAIPDERWSERPLACVVPKPGGEIPSTESLREHLAHNFAKFQLPDRFIIVDAIPKTSVGKLDKKMLRQRYADGGI